MKKHTTPDIGEVFLHKGQPFSVHSWAKPNPEYGRQVDRVEAFKIAHAAGQLRDPFSSKQPGAEELGSFMINPGDSHYTGERPSSWDIPVSGARLRRSARPSRSRNYTRTARPTR